MRQCLYGIYEAEQLAYLEPPDSLYVELQLAYLEPPDSLCVSAYIYYCDSDYIN